MNNTVQLHRTLVVEESSTTRVNTRSLIFAALLFVIVSALTDGFYLGDTVSYAEDIRKTKLTEFGHLLWYPVGWLGYQALGVFSMRWLGDHPLPNIVWALMALNWLAGLGCVLLVHSLVSRFSRNVWVTGLTTVAFIFTESFLNYTQSGASYIPGLLCLLLGFWFSLTKGKRQVHWNVWAGIAFGLSVALWVPYLFGLPAALLAPVILFGANKERTRALLVTSSALAATLGVIFLSGAFAQGIFTLAGLRAWIAESSHGADGSGIARTALGFARSFFNLGNDGLLFKRFLVHDPYNPVSFIDLVRASLWKLALFYAGLAVLLGALLWKRESRRFFWLWCVSAVPVVGFGVFWQGGDMERYLALLPATFIGLAYTLEQFQSQRWAQALAFAFIAVLVMVNFSAMYTPAVKAREIAAETRIKDLVPRLTRDSRVWTTLVQDDLWAFNRLFPFHPINLEARFNAGALVEPGMKQIETWREIFAFSTLETWNRHNDVWVSQHVRSQRPRADWYWAEGADKRIHWKEVYDFFAELELEPPVGGNEGFARVTATAANREKLTRLAQVNTLATKP